MTVKVSLTVPFRPSLSLRLLEGVRGVRELFAALPTASAVRVAAAAAAGVGPIQTRLRQTVDPPLSSELQSVDQAIAWTIALYRALRARHGDRALEIVERIVVQSGVRLMDRAFPRLDGPEPLRALERFVLPSLEHAARHGLYRLGKVRREDGQLAYDITYCRYVEACRVAGVAELAGCFCAVDGPFFAGFSDRLDFGCQKRLSAGDPACTFVFLERR